MADDAPVAFVTGGGGSIGYGIAKACLDAGWRVALADINDGAMQDAVGRLECSDQTRLMTVTLDVREPARWEEAADTVAGQLGVVTHLFNNAGVASARAAAAGGGLENLSIEEWRWVNSINLDGVFFGLKTFVPRFKASPRRAHIVTTSSMAGIVPLSVKGAIPLSYSATKAAVAHMSAQLRTDLMLEKVRHIGVSVLYPGLVRSNIQYTSLAMSPGESVPVVAPDVELVIAGSNPESVGRHVLKAIARGDFHIFPHAEWRDAVLAYRSEVADCFIERADADFDDPAAKTVDLTHVRTG